MSARQGPSISGQGRPRLPAIKGADDAVRRDEARRERARIRCAGLLPPRRNPRNSAPPGPSSPPPFRAKPKKNPPGDRLPPPPGPFPESNFSAYALSLSLFLVDVAGSRRTWGMGGGGTLRGADGDRAPAAGAEDRGGDQALGPGGDRRRGVEAEDLDGGNRARGPGADHPQAAGAEGRGGDRARAPASGDRRGGGDTARGTDGDRPQEAGVDDHHRGGGPSCGGAYGRARVPSGDCHVSARADCCDGHEEGVSS